MLVHLTPKERLGYVALGGMLLFGFGYVGVQHLRRPAPIVFETAPTEGAAMKLRGSSAGLDGNPTAVRETESSEPVIVHVVGAVSRPGVVKMAPSSRVVDAIEAAGGAMPDADLQAINLAAKLVDGTQLRVPSKDASGKGAQQKVVRSSPTREIALPPARVEFDPDVAPIYVAPLEQSPYARGEPTYDAGEPSPSSNTSRASSRSPKAKGPAAPVNVNVASASELETLPGVGPVIASRIVEYRQKHGPFSSVDALLAVRGIGPKKLEDIRPYVRL